MYYKVLTTNSELIFFNVCSTILNDCYALAEEAARHYFYGLGGWQEVWPLEISLYNQDKKNIGNYRVWILSSAPKFEAILI